MDEARIDKKTERGKNIMDSIKFSIAGLEQTETQDRVRNQLEGVIGVRNVSLSEGQDYVVIDYDEQTSLEEIHSHLQNNGYKILD